MKGEAGEVYYIGIGKVGHVGWVSLFLVSNIGRQSFLDEGRRHKKVQHHHMLAGTGYSRENKTNQLITHIPRNRNGSNRAVRLLLNVIMSLMTIFQATNGSRPVLARRG